MALDPLTRRTVTNTVAKSVIRSQPQPRSSTMAVWTPLIGLGKKKQDYNAWSYNQWEVEHEQPRNTSPIFGNVDKYLKSNRPSKGETYEQWRARLPDLLSQNPFTPEQEAFFTAHPETRPKDPGQGGAYLDTEGNAQRFEETWAKAFYKANAETGSDTGGLEDETFSYDFTQAAMTAGQAQRKRSGGLGRHTTILGGFTPGTPRTRTTVLGGY